MYHQFIEPSRFTADVVVTQGSKNFIALTSFLRILNKRFNNLKQGRLLNDQYHRHHHSIGYRLSLSTNRSAINWRTVGGAFAIQAGIGAFILYFEPGVQMLLGLSEFVKIIIDFSKEGIEFLFGAVGDMSLGFIFAFNVLPVIIFFSSLIAVLYHLGIMSLIIRIIGGGLQKLLKLVVQSQCQQRLIFLSVGLKRHWLCPFIPTMTRSELLPLWSVV